jgi:GNAT superfamily N-acetyltransferase
MGDIEYRDFDGDIDALGEMAQGSWYQEYGLSTWPDLYRPELLRHFFQDITDKRYLVGAYDGGRLVAFLANLPRTYRLNGKTHKAAVSCMLVGHKDYRKRGIILNLINDCLRRNEDIGADFVLMYLEQKHRSSELFAKHINPKHRIQRLVTMHPIARPIDFDLLAKAERLKWYERFAIKLLGAHRPPKAPKVPGTVRPYKDTDLPAILALTKTYPDDDRLVRVFDESSLGHQLHTQGATSTVVYEREGAVCGFMNYTHLDLLGPGKRYPWAWLDYLYWEGLSAREKRALIAGTWELARQQGIMAVMEWNKNYYRTGPLYRSRFIPYPRYLDLNAWVFNPDLDLSGIKSVFEQQV